MTAGIKIGLSDYQEKIRNTRAAVAEIYFRFDKKNHYNDLFLLLKKRGIKAGLHFWGSVKKNYLYNLAHPEKEIRSETLRQIQETIEIASRNKLFYVNVHPGNYQLVKLNLDQGMFEDGGFRISEHEGKKILLENIRILNRFASEKKVLFLVETVPSHYSGVWYNKKSRLKPCRFYDPSVDTIIELAEKGFYVTNDLGHTFADETSGNRRYLFKKLFEKTCRLAKQTKLIHVNTVSPPFNGTDTHDGILDSDFQKKVLPTKQQLIRILKIFQNRNDVWLIPEPLKNHEKNFLALNKLVSKISRNTLKNKPL